MKLHELIARVDKSDVNRDPVYVGALAEQMEIEDVTKWDDDARLRAYWLMKWYDSGGYCGLKAVFFDGECVATWSTLYGKSDGKVEWLSEEAYLKTRAYVLSFQQLYEPSFAEADLDEECGDAYSLQWTGQLMAHHTNAGYLDGKAVQIMKAKPGDKRDVLDHHVTVVDAEKKRSVVSVRDIKYPYHLEHQTSPLGEF